jgi:hypothetical protein
LAEAKMTNTVPDKPDATSHVLTQKKGFGVAASPFNGIKLELGICFILGLLLWLGAEFITADEGAQLMILLAYSLLATTWLVLRTRMILRRCEAEQSAP